MVLERYFAGASRHLSIRDGSKKLSFILCLPLIDGVFATLLVTGAVNTFSQMLNVAVTIFTGAGALAVLYSESEGREDALRIVNQSIPVLIIGSLIVALISPVFESIFNTTLLKYTASLTVLSISIQLADISLADKFPPQAIMLTGLLLSFQGLTTASITLEYIYPALVTAGLASLGLYLSTYLKQYDMNLAYIRYGGSLVLLIVGLSLIGLKIPDPVGPLVLTLAVLASLRK